MHFCPKLLKLLKFDEVVLCALMSAYRKGYSCLYTVIKLCEDLRRALYDGKLAGLLLMAFSKAFDCLSHDLLAAKLSTYGMCPDAVRLLINYLRGRKQRVKFGENTGEWMKTLKEETHRPCKLC